MSTPEAPVTTGTVEWYDRERRVGLISCDDGAPPCIARDDALHAGGIATLAAGDRVRFRIREEGGERVATDLTLLQAVQRWEDEGGAIGPTNAAS